MDIPRDAIASIIRNHGANAIGRRLRPLLSGKGKLPGMYVEMSASKRRAFRRACHEYARKLANNS